MKNDDITNRVDGRHTSGGSEDAGGMVERLLTAAGPGPEIPENGAARVKEIIRPAWRAGVTARSRQRSLLWLGGLAAAAALLIAVVYLPSLRPGAPAPPPAAITVAVVDGELEVTPPGANVEIVTADAAGVTVPPGSLVRTRPGSRASLWLAPRRSLRIDSETELHLDSEASLSLTAGAIYIDAQNGGGSRVEVRTALGTATEIGTQFEVRLGDGTLDVTVREGQVSLNREREDIRITEGVSLSITADGEVQSNVVTTYDPMWSWIQEITPTFEIEGRSALAFLDWVSSETGRSITFDNDEVEQLAATTTLHGSIEGLSPSEAPAVVLPSCRLSATESAGSLQIHLIGPAEESF